MEPRGYLLKLPGVLVTQLCDLFDGLPLLEWKDFII